MSNIDDFPLRMKGYSLVTVSVLYYMPDYKSIINEFIWQTLDLSPRYPRVEQFLCHWRREIDAVIKEVRLSDTRAPFNPSKYVKVIKIFKLDTD